MAQRKYTREEALEWMAQGHKARPPGWGYSQWLRAHNVHGYVDDSGTPMPHRPEMLAASDATGWTLLGRRRVERERRIAELEAELDAITSAADRQRGRAKTAEAELADVKAKLAKTECESGTFEEECDKHYRALVSARKELADLRTKLAAAEAEVQRFHNYSKLLTKTHESIESRLRTELEAAEAGRPRFKVGDRVFLKHDGRRFKVRDAMHAYRFEGGVGIFEENDLTPAPEPQPEPEQKRWRSVTAAEMRQALGRGERVSSAQWPPGWALWFRNGSYEREGEGRLHEFLRFVIAGTDEDDWQVWSHPLPGSGT